MKWYSIEDLYHIEGYKIKHSKNPKTKWIRLNCVYKIKINNKIKKDIIIIKDNFKNKKTDFPSKFKEYKHFLTKNDISRTNCATLPIEALIKALKLKV